SGKLLHINIDPSALHLVHRADIAINGDAAFCLAALCNHLNAEAGDEMFTARVLTSAAEVKQGLRQRIGKDYEAIMDGMRRMLPDDALIVRDTTVPAYNFATQLLPVYQRRSFMGPCSAAIGPGLPLAIGAASAAGRRTLLINGDGGFMLHATEMATAAQYDLPIIICIFNDGGYGVLRGLQTNAFEGRVGDVNLGFMDFVLMAKSMGVPGQAVKSLADFEQGFKAACSARGPYLLDIDMRCFELMKGSLLE
ncbi:MAG: thiamine pyrophosphate-dependent enzyme, partial [Gammaproteobacteria bacterium]|nr:thiamine pyrophosphate-dependent enzyme [Gammaproteobacteria bacterium]